MDLYLLESVGGSSMTMRDDEVVVRMKARALAAVEGKIVSIYKMVPIDYIKPDGRTRKKMRRSNPDQVALPV